MKTTTRDLLDPLRVESTPLNSPGDGSFRLGSTLAGPAEEAEVKAAWGATPLPADVLELWKVCRTARLFEDLDYGQWGLQVLAPNASARRSAQERLARTTDLSADDIVIGEFLGDQELLVVAPSEAGERRVLVALPLDGRSDWYGVAEDLPSFFARYVAAGGDKFWERTR